MGKIRFQIFIRYAKNEIIALIDSDDILPSKDWLSRMTEPFQDREIAGTKAAVLYLSKGGWVYHAILPMLGMNDPLCLFLGNYDRMCIVTGKWTQMPVIQEDKGILSI